MTFFGRARRCATGVVLCLSLCGCFPPGDNPSDEKKDPYFIKGKNLISQMDWVGAIEAFEKSLDANPHNASAHFELGVLCEEKATDNSAAIYHYERYLKLSPNPDKAEVARRIEHCKMELVKNMSAVGTPGVQRELERVVSENKNLQSQITQLQSQVEQWKAAAASRSQSPVTPSIQAPVAHSTATAATSDTPHSYSSHISSGATSVPISSRVSNSSTARTHSVKPRETMAGIARLYGISLAALESANPQVRPQHLLVGQTLKIPAP